MKKPLVLSLCLLISSITYANGITEETTDSLSVSLDQLWVLVAAVLVFMMQAGFKCLEVGLVREKHVSSVAMKNVIDWSTAVIFYFLVGFGIMFGNSFSGLLGTDLFSVLPTANMGNGLGTPFFIFQLAFVATALTIVSGAMSERTGFVPYILASVFISAIIYPFFGHWAWGSLFFSESKGWLENIGFIDFAGSTVVHGVGAWVALAGLILLGPRIGRFHKDGTPRNFKQYNIPYAVLGMLILWIGWWGFNGGSNLAFNMDVGKIITNTNLAGSSAVFAAYFHCKWFQKGDLLYNKIIGGLLGGLVAITASAHIQNPFTSLLIGFIAGVVHNISLEFLLKKGIDDAVGAIPVHGFCGILGTLLVSISPDFLMNNGEVSLMMSLRQLGIQALGAVSCFVWSFGTGYLVFKLCKMTVGLRVSPDEERMGLTIINATSDPDEENELNEQEIEELFKEAGI